MVEQETFSAEQTEKAAKQAVLIERIRTRSAGHEEAATELYKELERGFRFLIYRSVSEEFAPDILNDSFCELLQAIQKDELREPGALYGFARTIIRRKIMRYIHLKVRRQAHECELPETVAEFVGDERLNPETALFERERALAVSDVIAKELTPKQRDIIVRFYLHGQSQEQIQEEMKLSPGQFRNIKSQAKLKLQGAMSRKLVQEASPLKRLHLVAA